MNMFCYQCQEAAQGIACTVKGVCGKTDEVSNLQDILVNVTKGLAVLQQKLSKTSDALNYYVLDALFATITNANFDEQSIKKKIQKGVEFREQLRKELIANGVDLPNYVMVNIPLNTEEDYQKVLPVVNILSEKNEDVRSLRELIIYGLKGAAAYAEHAYNLGFEQQDFYEFMYRALAATTNDEMSVDELIALTMETGKYGVEIMALLDKANTTKYGAPEATEVNLGVGTRPGILISGHDLRDMEDLLKQTEGTGVEVYTHCEMLPAHYYPAFKKYKHFVGNYGNAWWQQREEFSKFNGPIVFTTNCIVPPSKDANYKDRVYTTGATGYPGFKHLPNREENGAKDFSEVIAQAKQCQAPIAIEEGTITGGFAHQQVMQVADKVVGAVKSGAIRKFFVMAGCDGRMKGRDYYAEFAQRLPKDTIILTAGCAKYRYNKLPLGDIAGIPRVLDAGQCNDSYSLAVIALKLKEVFGLNDVNELPISYNIAWYEQKAVIVLLALLYLGVKNIHLGPTLPAFLSPNVAKVLIENFGIAGIGTVDEDLKLFLGDEAIA